ncbi:MAG: hypothetical protein AB7O24_04735 [Kofleriaceae bacterium]
MTSMIGALTVSAVLLSSGCSLVATKGAPSQVGGPTPPDCSMSMLPVYVDGTVAAAAVATSLFIGLAALGNSNRRDELGHATLYTFLGSIPFAVSGIIGGVRVRSCRRAQDTWRSMQQPPPYGPPYAPPPPYPPQGSAPYPSPYGTPPPPYTPPSQPPPSPPPP